jgi:hypothetical protein
MEIQPGLSFSTGSDPQQNPECLLEHGLKLFVYKGIWGLKSMGNEHRPVFAVDLACRWASWAPAVNR